jgi:GT2 family glycosyltransferase
MADFSVIIPNFNGAAYLADCLPALLTAINQCPDSRFEVILVDNGSTDNSIEIFQSLITRNCQLITNSSNLGFAPAVNQGIASAKYRYICLLNNDLLLDQNWFSAINQNINQNVACYAGIVLNKTGDLIESTGLEFNLNGSCLNLNNGRKFIHSFTKPKPLLIWGASAAVIVYQKSVLEKIGLFDELFFAYIEDVDIAFRLHRLGFSTLFIPQAISRHLGGGTSSKFGNFRQRYTFRNWHLLILKDFSLSEILTHFPQILWQRLKNLSYLAKNTRVYLLPATVLSIYIDLLKNLPSILKKRRQFQNLLKLATK